MTSKVAVESFKTIPNSTKAPCVMQKAVAEHNSKYDTLKNDKVTVYKAPAKRCRKPQATS